MPVNIAVSTGVFYPHLSIKESLAIFATEGILAIEIGSDYAKPSTSVWEEIFLDDLAHFSRISLHAPAIAYGLNIETKRVFEKIDHLHSLRPLDCVVVHPDTVENFSVFRNVSWPVAFENMDWQKSNFQTAESMKCVFDAVPKAGLVLDVNHIYTNDKSMSIVNQFYDLYSDRLRQYHISGFKLLHDSLFLTKQEEILRAVKIPFVPLVIESQVPTLSALRAEIDYIQNYFLLN